MYDRLKAMYLDGRLTEQGLINAVTKGWITEAEKQEIIDSKVVV